MNVVILAGRLTKDPDAHRNGESVITRFTVAVDRRFRDKDGNYGSDFISCFAFGKTAEFVEKYFRKGMKIGIRGSIQTGSYTNKDGVKVYTTEVHVDEVEFGESKNASGQQAPQQTAPPPGQYQPPQQSYQAPPVQQNYQQPPQTPQPQYQQNYQQAPVQQPQQQAYQDPPWMNVPPGSPEELPFK